MNSKLIHSFASTVIIIAWLDEKNYSCPEIWTAFYLQSQILYNIKSNSKNPSKIPDHITQHQFSSFISPDDNSIKSGIDAFPNEILTEIFLRLPQDTLAKISITCKKWHRISNTILYKTPIINDIESIHHLVNLSKQLGKFKWDFKKLIYSIQFGSCRNGSLIGDDTIPGIQNINESHSCLYRMIVRDRNLYHGVHPIFQQLTRSFQNLINISEQSKKQDAFKLPSLFSSTTGPSLTMANYILARLFKYAKNFEEMKEWNAIDFNSIQPICIFLLEIFESEMFFKQLIYNNQKLKQAKITILQKLKLALNSLSGSLLLQVQFVTVSSQKLLDAYCLIYYEALDVSAGLNVEFFYEILKNETEIAENYSNEIQCIKACIRLMFRKNEEIDTDVESNIEIDKLRSAVSSFPPSGVNKETCEFLDPIIEGTVFSTSIEAVPKELLQWRRWIEMIIVWHKASKQMEPVKELLRGNMAKIDALRGVQRRYGISFMD